VRQIFLSGHDFIFIVMAFLFIVGSPERSRAIVPQQQCGARRVVSLP
jgi:hypothetical protein